MSNASNPETESTESPAGHGARNGKIARLPRHIREELNRRLLDGEPGTNLLSWANELPEVQDALRRHFGGRPINDQNLTEWKQGGFRDWLAKIEAAEWMAETLADGRELMGPGNAGGAAVRREPGGAKKEGVDGVADRVAEWFFPHYVAAARGRLAAAGTPEQQWAVLRAICADLSGLRRSEHYVERLRLWREKLQLDAKKKEVTEKEFLKWAHAQKDIETLLWPDRVKLTPEQQIRRTRQILGLDPMEDWTEILKGQAAAPAQPAAEELPEDAENIPKNQTDSN